MAISGGMKPAQPSQENRACRECAGSCARAIGGRNAPMRHGVALLARDALRPCRRATSSSRRKSQAADDSGIQPPSAIFVRLATKKAISTRDEEREHPERGPCRPAPHRPHDPIKNGRRHQHGGGHGRAISAGQPVRTGESRPSAPACPASSASSRTARRSGRIASDEVWLICIPGSQPSCIACRVSENDSGDDGLAGDDGRERRQHDQPDKAPSPAPAGRTDSRCRRIVAAAAAVWPA